MPRPCGLPATPDTAPVGASNGHATAERPAVDRHTMPGPTERRLLTLALNVMLAVAILAAGVLAWRFAGGPPPDGPPGVRVARLPPGSFVWASAPDDPRYLPDGLRAQDAGRLALLLLRERDGSLRAFYLPRQGGRASVPAAASPAVAGIPCEDMALDFGRGDIACRQTSAGFDFAARHRWSLQGRALSPGTPDLYAVPGQELDGDWLPQALRR